MVRLVIFLPSGGRVSAQGHWQDCGPEAKTRRSRGGEICVQTRPGLSTEERHHTCLQRQTGTVHFILVCQTNFGDNFFIPCYFELKLT